MSSEQLHPRAQAADGLDTPTRTTSVVDGETDSLTSPQHKMQHKEAAGKRTDASARCGAGTASAEAAKKAR